MRTALAKSKNMVSIRILQTVGANSAQEWIQRFGFSPDHHPPYLTMALGAGSVTPLPEWFRPTAFLPMAAISLIPSSSPKYRTHRGEYCWSPHLPDLNTTKRTLDERNAFVMGTLLQEITRSGTAAKAQATLGEAF